MNYKSSFSTSFSEIIKQRVVYRQTYLTIIATSHVWNLHVLRLLQHYSSLPKFHHATSS